MKKTNEHHENLDEVIEEEVIDEANSSDIEEVEEKSEVDFLKEEINQLVLALDNEKTKFLKAHADLENTKKRLTNDFNQRDKYKIQSFALGLLPAIDNMEKVLAEQSDDNDALKEAIEMIYRQLKNSLESEGISEIEALNEKFDPNIHHAVMVESVEGVPADVVIEVLQKGYMLKDRVLRASMVKVSQ